MDSADSDRHYATAEELLSAGVQLAYVSHQLGHADVAITARSYARWTGGDAYRAPLALGPGEVPADLLARMGAVATLDDRRDVG
jgi:integrase